MYGKRRVGFTMKTAVWAAVVVCGVIWTAGAIHASEIEQPAHAATSVHVNTLTLMLGEGGMVSAGLGEHEAAQGGEPNAVPTPTAITGGIILIASLAVSRIFRCKPGRGLRR